MLITNPLPIPLFKYTRRQDAESMMEHGHFLVGTLHEFRKVEAHGDEVGDPGEGTKQLFDNLDGSWQDVTGRRNLAQSVISAPPGADIQFSGVRVQVRQEVPNMYVFCVSAALSRRVMEAFHRDTCLAIYKPKAFFKALDAAMRAKGLVKSCTVVQCQYGHRERDIQTDDNVHPAQLKPARHSYQREYRALWEPVTQPIEPVFIDSLTAGGLLQSEEVRD